MAIVDLHRSDVETNIQGGVEFSFSKDAVNKLFQMMSNYMYSDKEYAVVSELAANAIDAHAMVGKQNVPIKVQLPTRLESEVVIRDFGPGMSEENVYRFLTQYGESSKGNTNDQIGAWGVGSKSPAAVSDSWSVISHHDGKRMHFEVFITAAGVPTLKKIFEGATDETGVEVRVPVPTNNHYAWTNAASRAFKHYKVKPEFNVHVELSPVKYEHIGDGWARLGRGASGRGGALIVTMREYQLDYTKIINELPTDSPVRKLFAGNWQKFDFMFGVGEISLSISREQIQYDEQTLKAITTRLLETHDQFKAKVKADLDAATNSVEYRQALLKWYNEDVSPAFLLSIVDGKYGIKVLPSDISHVRAEVDDLKGLVCVRGDKTRSLTRSFNTWGLNHIRVNDNWVAAKSKYNFNVNLVISHLTSVQVVIRDVHDTASRIRFSGDPKITYLILDQNIFSDEIKTVLGSTFAKAPREKRDPATELSACYIKNGNRFTRVPKAEYTNLLTSKTVVAVKIKNAVSASMNDEVISPELSFLDRNGWTIVGYKDVKPSALKGPKEALEHVYNEMVNDAGLKASVAEYNLKHMFNQASGCTAAMLMIREHDISSPMWDTFKVVMQPMIDHYKAKGTTPSGAYVPPNFNRWVKVCELLKKPTPTTGVTDISSTLEELRLKYPMLEMINVSWWNGSTNKEAVKQYIELVDSKI